MFTERSKLERELAAARKRVAKAIQALAPKQRCGEVQEYEEAAREQFRLEREVALSKGEEAACPVDGFPAWNTGAPIPHVLSSGTSTILLYLVAQPNPEWDGTTVRVIEPAEINDNPIAVVEFKRCYGHRFGGPNDEVLSRHPLHGRGLEPYTAHEIRNSDWIKAEMKTTSVHRGYREDAWTGMTHYFLAFHDECFECLAEGFDVSVEHGSFREAISAAASRILE